MIAVWEELRPSQNLVLDRKSAEKVAYLFSLREQRMGKRYINHVLIPLLAQRERSEEHTSDSSHQIISYAVFCLKKKKKKLSGRPRVYVRSVRGYSASYTSV